MGHVDCCVSRSTLSCAGFCVTFWSRMVDMVEKLNATVLVAYFIAADDFLINVEEGDANETWRLASKAPFEIGLTIHQSKIEVHDKRRQWMDT